MRKRQKTTSTSDGTTVRSGLEVTLYEQVLQRFGAVAYEQKRINYDVTHTYTPDIVLPNGVIIEGKGIFDSADRTKHLTVREQHPQHDIRFVFTRSSAKLYPGSKTTYADWCRKHAFKFADKVIPDAWLNEKGKH